MFLFQFRPYRCPFRQPLRTHHGLWSVREGILIRLTHLDTGLDGYGEIAPIPWFGSETLAEALQFCQQLTSSISEAQILAIPEELSACRFGLESAWLACQETHFFHADLSHLSFCYLLGADAGSLPPYPRVYKRKIGVAPIEQEWAEIKLLLEQLPRGSRLRLDANGGLTLAEAKQWLANCDALNRDLPGTVEWIEQPLPPTQHSYLFQLSQTYQTPIALDESVAQLQQLQQLHRSGWRGILVVKPALMGSCLALQDYLEQQHPPLDVVFSSALETPIGAWQGMVWAGSLQPKTAYPRAVGWGVGQCFSGWDPVRLVTASPAERAALMQKVWQTWS
ncbi:MAG: o-succinylbenzoate synthase [Thermostichus sp. DG_1_6_bins_120]